MTHTIHFNDLLANRTIHQIYTGLEAGCRCGCHGRYFEPGTIGFTRALNKALKLNPVVSETDNFQTSCRLLGEQQQDSNTCGGKVMTPAYRYQAPDSNGITEWIDISLGNGKTITLYLKD